VLDDQVLALDTAALARVAQQLVRESGHESRSRQAQALEFLGVDQTAGTVAAEYELIAFDDLSARAGLRCAEVVSNHLEYQVVRGQGKYDHDQAAFPGRMDEAVDGGAQVPLQSEISFRLALLGAAENRVQLIDRLAGHE